MATCVGRGVSIAPRKTERDCSPAARCK